MYILSLFLSSLGCGPLNQALDCDLWDPHYIPCSVIETLSCCPKFLQDEHCNDHFEICGPSFHEHNPGSHHLTAYIGCIGAGMSEREITINL